MAERIYTASERAKRARLLVKGAKGAYGDTSAVERELERIDAVAEDRARREAAAHQRELERARDELATAKVRERAAVNGERSAARAARKNAESRLRAVERAARR